MTTNFTEIQTALDNARNALVRGVVNTGELISNYGKAMEYAFDKTLENGDTVKWFDLKGKAKAGVKQEYARFVETLKGADLEGNKYVYWQRVKEACGYQTVGNKAKATLTIDAKNLAELKTILNRILNNESDDDAELSNLAKSDLISAFGKLGGDVETI
jgi:hypothetical protein